MHPIEEAFEPLIGLPSWLVRQGHGSFVTFEFGEPHVNIGEPRMGVLRIDGAPPKAWQRLAKVRGQWHLWIYGSLWSISLDTVQLAHSESDNIAIARALGLLGGQAISEITVDPADASTRFTFDLGYVMETTAAPPGVYDSAAVEQWMLHQPSGDVLTVRSDGMYGIHTGDTPPADARWTPLPR